MSNRTPISSQTTKLDIVIRKNIVIPINLLEDFCKIHFKKYAFCAHLHDVSPDTGEEEGAHYHIVADCKKNKTPISTRINDIRKFFGFENNFGINIQEYDSFEARFQYLIHKGYPDKTQHKPDEIHHNLTDEEFDCFLNAEIGNVITYDLLITYVMSSSSILEVMKKVGVAKYRTYRNVILDMWKCWYSKDKDLIKN